MIGRVQIAPGAVDQRAEHGYYVHNYLRWNMFCGLASADPGPSSAHAN
jgi:hypothetical protein